MSYTPPANFQVTAYYSNGEYDLTWSNTEGYEIEIYRNVDGGTWSWWTTVSAGTTFWYKIEDIGYTIGYKIRYYGPLGYSDFAGPIYRSLFEDTKTTSGLALAGSYTDTVYLQGTFIETSGLKLTGSYVDVGTFSDTKTTPGIRLVGSYKDSLSAKPDWAYFLGAETGEIYKYHSDYTGDAGSEIISSWESKITDFSEINPALEGRMKTVYSATLFYEDLASSAGITIYISNDGGATWESSYKAIGTNSGKTKNKIFYFISTGQYFKFKIEHSSSDKNFKWLGLKVEFEPGGEYFEIT